jgi:hypothetical protein
MVSGFSYADAVRRGASASPSGSQRTYGSGSIGPVKHVSPRHKKEIIILRGEETPAERQRTAKELADQLKVSGIEGKVVAVRKLPSGDSLSLLWSRGKVGIHGYRKRDG